MRKGFMGIISLVLVFCLVLAGCGSAQAKDSGSEEAAESSAETAEEQDTPEVASEQDTPEVTQQEADQQAAEGEETMTANEQTTPEVVQIQEIWVQNGDDRIYGVAYVPVAEDGKKVPLVIFSHELGNDHTSGERYAERLAEAGYAAYVFDFRGGTVGGNRSDGSNSEMSILTEASDLESVLAAAKTWDFVDPDKIVLLGGSMGGLVTTVVGSTHQDEIAGMILMYPALSAKDDSGAEQYQSEDDVPEDVSLFGGWIHVGKNYITDLWTVDFDQLLSSYQGHMLLLHGDKDNTVPLSYSEAAREIIPDCEFYVIKDGGVSDSEEGETMLQMTIGETPVEVEWEDNESVEALRELCENGPLTIQMSMYGGFEQVGSIGQRLPRNDSQTTTESRLPRNDSQTTTESGDIVLYSGDQIVVFYGSNSWAYTRLGHVTDKSDEEMAQLLGNGDVTITVEMK